MSGSSSSMKSKGDDVGSPIRIPERTEYRVMSDSVYLHLDRHSQRSNELTCRSEDVPQELGVAGGEVPADPEPMVGVDKKLLIRRKIFRHRNPSEPFAEDR